MMDSANKKSPLIVCQPIVNVFGFEICNINLIKNAVIALVGIEMKMFLF